jgi:iron complex outermembrane receptor protein
MNYQLNSKLNLFIDGQYRYVNYAFEGINILGESLPQEVTMHFFNPKAGLTYGINDAQQTYFSFSVGNKEPNRNDFTDNPPENRPVHETVYDTELGWRYRKNKLFAGVNVYNMQYKNQLILTGKINDVGAYTRQNVSVSYRRGIEVEGGYLPFNNLSIVGNMTYSNNVIPRFVEYIDNYDTFTQDSIVYTNAPIAFSPNIISAVTITYTYKKLIETGFIIKHVGRQYLDNTGQESRSIDPYTLLDYRFTWHIPAKSMQNLSVSAFVYNVLDLRYNANGYTYGWIAGGAEERYNFFYPQAGRNFMIMLNAKF